MKRTYRPDPTTQRVQSHAKRKELARALHWAHNFRVTWQRMRTAMPRIPKSLRRHRELLIRTLISA